MIVTVGVPKGRFSSDLFGTTPLVKKQVQLMHDVIDQWSEEYGAIKQGEDCCKCVKGDQLLGPDVVFTRVTKSELSENFNVMNQSGSALRLIEFNYAFDSQEVALEFIRKLTLLKYVCVIRINGEELQGFKSQCKKATRNECFRITVLSVKRGKGKTKSK